MSPCALERDRNELPGLSILDYSGGKGFQVLDKDVFVVDVVSGHREVEWFRQENRYTCKQVDKG